MLRTGAILVSVVILGLLPFALSLGAGQVPALRGIERVSVADDGSEGNAESGIWQVSLISADGRYVAFHSDASDLVPNDWNEKRDVFVHDRQTGQTKRVSVSSDALPGNGNSLYPSLSADGRYVAFVSRAGNLVDNDTNDTVDIFVHDCQTGKTSRVSVASDGAQGNGESWLPSISADGCYVCFASHATNLVPDDTNGAPDVFVHDRQTGQTKRVSVSSEDAQGNRRSSFPRISADGRCVAFESAADNLVPEDGNRVDDVFAHDRDTGRTTRANVASDGTQSKEEAHLASLSTDGRYVAFVSGASDLVSDDTNNAYDVFIHDRQTGQTKRVSVGNNGAQSNQGVWEYSISGDGRYVAFASSADDLVPGDSNEYSDIFVHDCQTGQTARVNLGQGGADADWESAMPSLSPDGRYVVFTSKARNLVRRDTNEAADVFLALNPLFTPGSAR